MKRRTFIQTGSLITLPILLRGMEVSAISRSSLMDIIDPDSDKILILVQLNGGNDGLNTFIPIDQYTNLSKVRSSIMIPESSVLKANDTIGFHPAMTGFKGLYDEGKMAVVQGVSYPNQNRSHFRSTDIWSSASDAEDYVSSGWLGRYLDVNYPGFPEDYPNDENPDPFAITIGSILSETCQGPSSNFSYAVSSSNIYYLNETEEGIVDSTCYGMELQFVRNTVKQSNQYSTVVTTAFDIGGNTVTYPEDNRLAAQLKIVANLISGGLKTKIYITNLGGFDTHANQVVGGDTLIGEHSLLLQELSDAITAFQHDIDQAGFGEKVVGMTFSEFGRRIKANDSFGTDHGTAAPLFVFGNCVNSGVFGENAQISDNVDDQEGVALQNDFRSVYASILMDWFGADKSQVEDILFKEFQYIPLLKNCSTTNATQDNLSLIIDATLSPNPSAGLSQLSFTSEGGLTSIEIYNVAGARMKTIMNRRLTKGDHTIPLELFDLSSGQYFVRLEEGRRNKTLKLVLL